MTRALLQEVVDRIWWIYEDPQETLKRQAAQRKQFSKKI